MMRGFRARVFRVCLSVSGVLLGASGTALAAAQAAPDLDTAITQGFGKLVKYGRWTAALVLGIVFLLAWAERTQNPDNPHEVNRATRKMIWTALGFVAVIGYKLVLVGITQWFGVDPTSIPTFLWQ